MLHTAWASVVRSRVRERSCMVIPQLSKPGGIMTDSSGELIVDSGAIETIAGAYEQAAYALDEITNGFSNRYSRASFGDLPSIEQLRQGYLDLAVESPTSAAVRLQQFADAARNTASRVRDGGKALDTTDASTSRTIEASLPHGEEAP